MKKVLVVLFVAIFLSLIGIAKADAADVRFVNASSYTLIFRIDGVQAVGAVPPGDSQMAITTIGNHTLTATTVERFPRTARRTGYIGPNGVVWTVTNK